MTRKAIDKIIQYMREEMMVSGSNPQGFSSAANPKGPVAGFDPEMEGGKVLKRRKTYIYQKGVRKNWKNNGKSD